jgi:hypothetical protein
VCTISVGAHHQEDAHFFRSDVAGSGTRAQ